MPKIAGSIRSTLKYCRIAIGKYILAINEIECKQFGEFLKKILQCAWIEKFTQSLLEFKNEFISDSRVAIFAVTKSL